MIKRRRASPHGPKVGGDNPVTRRSVRAPVSAETPGSLERPKTMTDEEIAQMISVPKTIASKTPAKGYRDSNGHRRCDVELRSESLELRYRSEDAALGTITLVRYNGPHGELRKGREGHFAVLIYTASPNRNRIWKCTAARKAP